MRYGLFGFLIALLSNKKHRRVLPDKGQHTYDKDYGERHRYSDKVSPGVSRQKDIPRSLAVDPRQGKVGH